MGCRGSVHSWQHPAQQIARCRGETQGIFRHGTKLCWSTLEEKRPLIDRVEGRKAEAFDLLRDLACPSAGGGMKRRAPSLMGSGRTSRTMTWNRVTSTSA